MLPIATLYRNYCPERGDAPSERLSRHVMVQHSGADQFSSDRALIAVMLQASILPVFQTRPRLADAQACAALSQD